MQSFETAAFAAWPSIESEAIHGWQLRLDRGYTKRANSANASDLSSNLTEANISDIEARFRKHGLEPVFRIPSHAQVAATENLLIGRGYHFTDLSLVMARPLNTSVHAERALLVASAGQWLEVFQSVSGKTGADQVAHLEILRRIRHPVAYAMYEKGGQALCCGMGVLVGDKLGLFDIATRADWEGQGLAKRLCNSLLAWGHEMGARTAFLQVVGANARAINLYEHLGFRTHYHYWYRVLSK